MSTYNHPLQRLSYAYLCSCMVLAPFVSMVKPKAQASEAAETRLPLGMRSVPLALSLEPFQRLLSFNSSQKRLITFDHEVSFNLIINSQFNLTKGIVLPPISPKGRDLLTWQQKYQLEGG